MLRKENSPHANKLQGARDNRHANAMLAFLQLLPFGSCASAHRPSPFRMNRRINSKVHSSILVKLEAHSRPQFCQTSVLQELSYSEKRGFKLNGYQKYDGCA